MRWTWMAVLALTAGCEGIDLGKIVKPPTFLTQSTEEPPGPHCAHGGQRVQTGLDVNADGQLGEEEASNTTYSCNPALVRIQPEPAGANCASGGHSMRTGPDRDADGELDAAEVLVTEYFCASPMSDVLVRTRQVAPGDRCPNGGQVSHAGRDENGNGTLEDTEITREVYGCNEPERVLTRVRLAEYEPLYCPTDASRVEAGLDVDRDGVFDDTELRAAVRICVEPGQALAQPRQEPSGSNCTRGGTAVNAGRDTNQDGAITDNEVLGTLYVCHGSNTYFGSYEVRTPADLVALGSISNIRGNLTIANTEFTDIVLPGLASVEGMLIIGGNPQLVRVELRGLSYVATSLMVSNNERLETLVVGNPANSATPERAVRVGHTVALVNNPQLATLAGLAAVSPHRNFDIIDNDRLERPGTLPLVEELVGGVTVRGNAALKELPFINLFSVGTSVFIEENPALESLMGLNRLRTVGISLYLFDNDALTSLSGLGSFDRAGTLSVLDNDSLLSAGVSDLSRVGSITIADNDVLEAVEGMDRLEHILDGMTVERNPKLVSVKRFPVLLGLDALDIRDNPLLTDLSAFVNLLRLPSLSVTRNGALTSLSAFSKVREMSHFVVQENPELTQLGLSGLVDVSQYMYVTDNPKLPQCQATALADAVFTGRGLDIARNDEAATCGQ